MVVYRIIASYEAYLITIMGSKLSPCIEFNAYDNWESLKNNVLFM
jgi:hypothetical protein